MSLQNVKKPAYECSFPRSYRVAACSFTKNKTPSKGFLLQFAIRLVVPCCEIRNSYKIDKTIFIIITFNKWSVFLVFRKEGISYGPYSTRWYHFLQSFS